VAVSSEMFAACCIVLWAVSKDVLDCLYSLSTRASNLVRYVLGKKHWVKAPTKVCPVIKRYSMDMVLQE